MNEFALAQHRQLFPALANKSYFNFGGQGVLAQPTLDAMVEAFGYIQRQGPFGVRTNAWVSQVSQRARAAFAGAIGVAAETISLTENVTVGCNIALWGMDWQAGDHILLTDCEHPGVVAAIQEIQHRYGVITTTMPLLAAQTDEEILDLCLGHLQPRTKLVVLSHVLWNSGRVLPLVELTEQIKAASRGPEILVLVDAAQSVGLLPLELSNSLVDFYAFTGHKWCCGPEGVGGLYVRPAAREALRPTFIGWRSLSYEATAGGGLLTDGRQYEVATSAYPLYAGLAAAIDLQNQWGDRALRYQRICQLSSDLWQRLQALPQVQCLLPTPPASGLVSFRVDGVATGPTVQKLETEHIYIRNLGYPDSLRACIHYLTNEEEVDRLILAIANLK